MCSVLSYVVHIHDIVLLDYEYRSRVYLIHPSWSWYNYYMYYNMYEIMHSCAPNLVLCTLLYRPTGFSGLPTEAVSYALAYLSHLLLVKTVPVDKGEGTTTTQFITPRLDLPDVFELLHHTNQVSLGFVKEAFVGMSCHPLHLHCM